MTGDDYTILQRQQLSENVFRTKIKAGPLFSALPAAFGGLGAGIVYEWEERFSEVY